MGFWLFGWNKVIRLKNQGFQICTKVDADDKVFPIYVTNKLLFFGSAPEYWLHQNHTTT